MGGEVCSEKLKKAHKSTKECSAGRDRRDGEGQLSAIIVAGCMQLLIHFTLILHLFREIPHPHLNLQLSLLLDGWDNERDQLVHSCHEIKQQIPLCWLWEQAGAQGHTFHNRLLLLENKSSLLIKVWKSTLEGWALVMPWLQDSCYYWGILVFT